MNRKKIVSLILSCLLLFSGCAEGSTGKNSAGTETTVGELPVETEQNLTETDLRVRKSLVYIQAGDLHGSGVTYDENEDSVLIATAGHVLAHDTGEILVTFPNGTQVAVSGVKTATSCDVAFLWVDKAELSETAWKACLPVQTDRDVFDSLETYEDVWMYGAENGEPVYAFVVDPWIYVEDFEQYMLLLQGLMVPGMSGGGVFTEDGIFLGIMCGADEDGKVAVVPYSMVEMEKPEEICTECN